MAGGLVLVIEDDEWVSRLLSAAIRDAGYDVVVCGTAKAGLDTACAVEPDCIICDVDLPDQDGYHVARNVRTQPSRVSVTPFLFLSGLDDQESRLEGFHVGADVYMTKPFRVDEVVAQVGALVQMAARLRARRDSFLSIPSNEGNAIEGDLSQMSIATVLTVLEMERRTGVFEVVSKKRRAQLEIAAGYIIHGTVGGTTVSALAALRTMLSWNVGRFSFAPSQPRDPPATQKSIGAFLIEAVRLEDETTRDGAELLPSSKRPSLPDAKLPAPAFGGPPSVPDDLAPPSSRSAAPAARQAEPRAAAPAAGGEARVDAERREQPVDDDATVDDAWDHLPTSPTGNERNAVSPEPPRTGLKLAQPPARQAALPPPPMPGGNDAPSPGTRIPTPPLPGRSVARPAGDAPGKPGANRSKK